MEFGTPLPDALWRSIKGELLLPIEQAVTPSAPYACVRYSVGTVCGLCHSSEQPASDLGIPGAFSSAAFRPRPETRVAIEELRAEYQSCEPQLEPHRCQMLAALFGVGEVVENPFPSSTGTFY